MKQPTQMNISPFAILAAILFNTGKTEKIKVKPADLDEEIEVDCPMVAVAEEADTLVCMIPFDKITYFMAHPHKMELRIDNGVAILAFEKQEINTFSLVDTSGKAISAKPSDKIEKLVNQLKGI